ncbi:carbamate kinase [Paenibacillus thiaminolyticus]|uniref:carbamate kinase n=1 Tax=Paenibacillus thiaminolyticus TaxID=49283 RepID=UPI00233127DD|nr:carbamate kinase [Paenibacillus thiaminolyticus]WCF06526.1 carbamate kinase [Paenibacillus thiaminolyticus]
MMKTVLIALGGNAILQANQTATYETQLQNIRMCCTTISNIVNKGYRVLLTHGNGPQVGHILLQNEMAKNSVPMLPLHVCSAESQGFIGYMIQQSLLNELTRQGIERQVICLVTSVEVSPNDDAFGRPSKPIGSFYNKEEAERLAAEKGWSVKEDSNRGWRRVVPSPSPRRIIGSQVMRQLLDANHIVIAAGGGGIPVVRTADGTLEGVDAVIDKDRTGSLLAKEIGADTFIMLTDVEQVYINFGEPEQQALGAVSIEDATRYLSAGQFGKGSMEPKMNAALDFAESGGTAIIASLRNADLALEGKAGTRISKGTGG